MAFGGAFRLIAKGSISAGSGNSNTASLNPVANSLLLIVATIPDSDTNPPAIGFDGFGSSSWNITTVRWGEDSERRLSVGWLQIGGSTPSPATVAISKSDSSVGAGSYQAWEITGVLTSGAVVQTGTGFGSTAAAELNSALAAFASANNATFVAMAGFASVDTPVTGYTYGDIQGSIETLYRLDPDTTPSIPLDASDEWGLIALELANGLVPVTGTAAPSLPNLTANAQGNQPVTMSGASSLPNLTALGAGIEHPRGAAVDVLPNLTALGAGQVNAGTNSAGFVTSTLPNLVMLASGHMRPSGAAAIIMPGLRMVAEGVRLSPVVIPTFALPEPVERPRVYVHNPYWPYHRIAELTIVGDIARAFQLMRSGPAQFRLAARDPLATPYVIARGNIVAIEPGTPGFPVWAGPIVNIEDDGVDLGTATISCTSMETVLESRLARQKILLQGAAGSVFSQLIRQLNAGVHSGLFTIGAVELGPRVSVDGSAQTIFRALEEVTNQSGYEWWIENYTSPSRLESVVYFGQKQGFFQDEVILYQGHSIAGHTYTLDTTGLREVAVIYGGNGPVSARTALVRASGGTRTGAMGNGLLIERASERYTQRADIPPLLRNESVFFNQQSSDRTALSNTLAYAMESGPGGLISSERFRLRTNDKIAWSSLALGNYIRVRTKDNVMGTLDRIVRINGVQPDEEMGVLDLTVGTPLT